MLTLRGIITLLVLAVLFALAVVWISKNGGWKGEYNGYYGNGAKKSADQFSDFVDDDVGLAMLDASLAAKIGV